MDRAELCNQRRNRSCISTIEFSMTAKFHRAHPVDRSGRLQAQILEGGLEPLRRVGNGTFLFRHVQPKGCFDLSSNSIVIDIVIPRGEKRKELVLSQLDISPHWKTRKILPERQNSPAPAFVS